MEFTTLSIRNQNLQMCEAIGKCNPPLTQEKIQQMKTDSQRTETTELKDKGFTSEQLLPLENIQGL